MNIFLVEDDSTLSRNISDALKAELWNVEVAYDGLLAEKMIKKNHYDCVILDVNLPGKNGFNICKSLRVWDKNLPVLMLTAFGELEDKVKGFDCGADDYLTKPFFMRELILRVQALSKRAQRNSSAASGNSLLIADDITLNENQKKVLRQGEEISLTPREYQILLMLMKKSGEIVSKKELVQEIWGRSFDANTNTVEVYVNFLRNKLDKPFNKSTIKTKVGYGYYLEVQ